MKKIVPFGALVGALLCSTATPADAAAAQKYCVAVTSADKQSTVMTCDSRENSPKLQNDPHFRDHLLFFEYFHGDSGRGVGASHQTGWTGLIAELLQSKGASWVAEESEEPNVGAALSGARSGGLASDRRRASARRELVSALGGSRQAAPLHEK